MNIKYIVGKYEVSGGGVGTIEEHEFLVVEDAIAFYKEQKEGIFSWWDILVNF